MGDSQAEATSLKQQGNDAYKRRDFESALQFYSRACDLDPGEMTFKLNKAAVYFEQGNFQDCIKECHEAIDVGRANRADFKLIAKAFTRIANSHKRLSQWENAKIYFEKSLSEHRTPETRSQLAEIERIIREQERKAYVDPEKAEQEKEKGNEMFKKGDFAGAVKQYTEAIRRNPDDPKLYSNRAACYTKLGAFDLGLKDCDKCTHLDPNFIKGYLRKGKILQGMQESAKALSAYERALEIDPSNAEAREGYYATSRAAASNPEEMRRRAMADPEVQNILKDPAMRLILEQMQTDPKALQDHLRNPEIASKIQKLLDSGLIAIR